MRAASRRCQASTASGSASSPVSTSAASFGSAVPAVAAAAAASSAAIAATSSARVSACEPNNREGARGYIRVRGGAMSVAVGGASGGGGIAPQTHTHARTHTVVLYVMSQHVCAVCSCCYHPLHACVGKASNSAPAALLGVQRVLPLPLPPPPLQPHGQQQSARERQQQQQWQQQQWQQRWQ
jgi:hypothetical protein